MAEPCHDGAGVAASRPRLERDDLKGMLMTGLRRGLRQGIVLALAVTTLSVVGVAATTGSVSAKPTGKGDIAKARFFSFNDFHGALDAAWWQRRSGERRPSRRAARNTSPPP